MNIYYTILTFSIVLYAILLHNYQEPSFIQTSASCSSEKKLCVVCPSIRLNRKNHKFNKYTQISSKIQFYLLGATDSFIMKNECRQVLELFSNNEVGERTFAESVHNDIRTGKTVLKRSHEVNLASGKEYILTISEISDFIVFYQSEQLYYPTVKIENQSNPQRLMKISRSICWAVLFALVLKYIDRKVGLFTELTEYPLPLVEISILLFLLYSSYDIDRFANIFIAELMFLAFAIGKIIKNFDKHQEIIFLSGFFLLILLSLVQSQMNALADLLSLFVIKRKMPKLRKAPPKIKTITALILICLVTNSLEIIGSLNFFIYSAYAWKAIFIPISFLLLQERELSEETKQKLHQTAGKYLENLQ